MPSCDLPNAHPRHAQLAQRIVDAAVANTWSAGMRMREEELAQMLEVSRTPVRAALRLLAHLGLVVATQSRGFALAQPGEQLVGVTVSVAQPVEERLRDALIRDRLAGRIAAEQSQVALARSYGASLPVLQRVIHRMEQEGLVVRKGWRWAFVPTLEDGRSQEASYEVRLMVEPAALLLPGFQMDLGTLRQLADEHHALFDTLDHASPEPSTIFELDAKFHETLASFSRNPFVENVIRQQNALRRLLELKSYGDSTRVTAWCHEHLKILRTLATGDRDKASRLLREHLLQARAAAERARAKAHVPDRRGMQGTR